MTYFLKKMATAIKLPSAVFEPLQNCAKQVTTNITNPITRALYSKALEDFLVWLSERGSQAFSGDTVRAHCTWLLRNDYSTSTVNQRLSAIRKLALHAAERRIVSIEHAAAILRIKGERRLRRNAAVSLDRQQTKKLLAAPDISTIKGIRDRTILALLVACGLRRSELVSLRCDSFEQWHGRWLLRELAGRNGRVRTVPVPTWVKDAIDEWLTAAQLTGGALFVRVVHGKPTASPLTPQTILDIVRFYGRELGMDISPEDLRRTCARLCRSGGGELEQIQLLLGHARIQITEEYLGKANQDLRRAPNDRIVLRLSKAARQAGL
jgi:site-specific recombinase XerD